MGVDFMEFLRKIMGFDKLFYKWVFGVMHYDCGRLPCDLNFVAQNEE